MPIITQIKPQKNQKRVNVYLDDKFAFGLDLENFVKLNLRVGTEFSDKEIKEIVKKAEFQKTYDKILRFASLRPRSKKEYSDWLRKHKVHITLHKKLFNRLKHLEFLDDRKFAAWWIEQRLQFKFKSKKEIESELRIKGIDKNVIEDVLSEVKIDEVKMAKRLIEKKRYRWVRLEPFEARKKISAFLLQKGFGWDVIREVVTNSND
ncbi:hypothetical protein A2Z22_02100 [Candidatus Woesebacteria bacterium RBG_16_34_12]|uniref:Regulatory protein RecX n=1 Tax=Candidatus Woesebacteria bacterium RBG_16_34_12 TaxID=1802480 RepID=A0A1F7X9X5_9BACT|nr:MAG: hypothetical protein A2Z22_02100 [Candidatus Woesebacteria bacterium RBG_16_34_12]